MASTYLELVNKVLLRMNETTLDRNTFEAARNIHASTKEAVKDTVNRLNKISFKWPFNAAEHTMTLTPGTNEYGWPSNFKVVDWNTFQIQKDDTFNVQNKTLRKINRSTWYGRSRDLDSDTGALGRGIPEFVFEAHGRGFGISPSPKEAYTLKFRYFLNPPELVNWDDETTIPTEWDYVIVSGALYLMKLFKADAEQAMILKKDFTEGKDEMTTLLVSNYDSMQDTRV